MDEKTEVLKLALEALEECRRDPRLKYEHPYYDKTITAIREALAAVPEPHKQQSAERVEPVAVYVGDTWCGSVVRLYEDLPLETPLYTSPPAQQQEPVAYASDVEFDDETEIIPAEQKGKLGTAGLRIALYLGPPAQRKPLPAHEIVTMYDESPTSDSDMIAFARAIEAAHGIMSVPDGKGDA